MYIDNFSLEQIIIAISFIAILVLIQIYILKNKSKIKNKWSVGKRTEIRETTRLGPTEKLQIIRVDNREYLYFFSKGSQPVILPIEGRHRQVVSKQTTAKGFVTPQVKPHSGVVGTQNTSHNDKTDKTTNKIMQAISAGRKLNPKVSFD